MKLRTIPALLAVALLAGCSGENANDQASDAAAESIEVTTSTTPVFQEEEVETIVAPDNGEKVHDPGLNVDVHFQGTGYGSNGGSIIYVAVTNLNEAPLPVDAIEQPTLKIVDYDGELTDIEPLEGDDNIPLDLPLGSGATTNLQWAYNTSNGSLWSAEFQIGNIIFDGDLNNR